jgi:hypothetical protein
MRNYKLNKKNQNNLAMINLHPCMVYCQSLQFIIIKFIIFCIDNSAAVLSNEDKALEKSENHEEKWFTILLQIVLPFFIAGFGMVWFTFSF